MTGVARRALANYKMNAHRKWYRTGSVQALIMFGRHADRLQAARAQRIERGIIYKMLMLMQPGEKP